MRAVRCARTGPSEVLELVDLGLPMPDAGRFACRWPPPAGRPHGHGEANLAIGQLSRFVLTTELLDA